MRISRPIAITIVTLIVVSMLILAGFAIWKYFQPDPRFEGIPELDYYVTDEVGVLYNYYEIEDICYTVDMNTSCEIAVLIVNSTLPRSANEFALRTFQMNEIGKEGKDNGVLILIVTSTREWKVEVGYGLEGVITPTFLNQIATDYVIPYLEVDDYGEGAYNMALFIGAEILDKYEGAESGDPAFPIHGIPLTITQWIIIIVILVALTAVTRGRIWYLLFFILTFGRGGGGFGGGRSGGGGGGGRF
ncbi:MAG TPA: TPM domain-containing protein [Methanomassiliicoccales archaeon]|nr:TPM domain-containing protein [Methanomassiliicoccales archaeon]HPR97955.1 TPM domain-containing protein [Methanomassiliicoccales archaeon]